MTPSVDPVGGLVGFATPQVEVVSQSAAFPSGGPGQPGGFSPEQIRQAYGFNNITFNGGSIRGDGTGQTIAIVDAYNQPNIVSDLAKFNQTYGLPAANLTVVNQSGGTSLPAADSAWGLEISLDVEWAHAMAPGANILLVEANTSSYADLLAAVDYARHQPNVSVVSMSWGGFEWPTETAYDSYFTTPAGHKGITFIAASGDNGSSGAPIYPSVSPNVLAVGGTQLTTDATGNYVREVGWSGSGGGIGYFESQPGYQRGTVTQNSAYRATPDVSYNGSGSSPFAVYDTSSYGGWIQVYGTSAGAPQWASLLAIANQGRALAGQSSLDGVTQTLPMLYKLPQSDFHDITSGSNGAYSATPGYDLVTGRGSPIADRIVAALAPQPSISPNAPKIVSPASASANPVNGTTTNLSVRANDAGGEAGLIYSWSVLAMPSGVASPTASINVSNAAQNTTITFYGSGVYTFQVTVTDPAGLTAISTVNVTVNQTLSGVLLTPGSVSLNNGGAIRFAAAGVDQFGHAMDVPPNWNWSLSGAGALNGNGSYTAPATGTGTAVIEVSAGGVTQTVTVTFAPPPPPKVPPNPWSAWIQLVDGWVKQQMPLLYSYWRSLLAAWGWA